jgi:hypothetical protein
VLRIIGGVVGAYLVIGFWMMCGASFGLFLVPFSGFVIQLVREEANRDRVQLVQHRILFKKRDLIPTVLKAPYPPCREWLKTAPRWVGEAVEENPRYRLWRGFLDTALHLLRLMLGIDKKPLGEPVFGKSGPASREHLKKAGLL